MSRDEIEAHISEHERLRAAVNAAEKRNREISEQLAALPERIADEIARRSNTEVRDGGSAPFSVPTR